MIFRLLLKTLGLPLVFGASVLVAEPFPVITSLDLPGRDINEASGLSRSHRQPDLLWTLNDSGAEARIYALDTQGRQRASVTLTGPGVINQDWEDMASFSQGGKHYLLIGDVGDNFAWRPNITLYLIEEPVLPKDRKPVAIEAPVLHSFRVTLANGPRDIEAIAVDAEENAAYLISKRDPQPQLFRVSLQQSRRGAVTERMAVELGAIRIPRAERNNSQFNWVTAMDFSSSGRWAYVGTLRHGYRYARAPGQSWQQALQQQPVSFSLPRFTQIEGGCFDGQDDDQLYVISENLPAKMARITLPAP